MTNKNIQKAVKKAIRKRSVKPISDIVNFHIEEMSINQMQYLMEAENAIIRNLK